LPLKLNKLNEAKNETPSCAKPDQRKKKKSKETRGQTNMARCARGQTNYANLFQTSKVICKM
jgi:hypothetical protein